MTFLVNNSPWAGREGEYVTSRKLGERILFESRRNVSIRIEQLSADSWRVMGRGELQLAVILETMRREGYEVAGLKADRANAPGRWRYSRADGISGRRYPGRLYRHGHAAFVGPQRPDAHDGDPCERPCSPGIRRAGARTDRFSRTFPCRDARPRRDAFNFQWLRSVVPGRSARGKTAR